MKGILGRKVGMTEVFTKEGKLIPVTVVKVDPNVVTQIKTVETDGYNAIQLATVDKKEKNATKASINHAKKANTTPKRFLKEIRDYDGSYDLGSVIAADVFAVGDYVDVTGTSKGKGFQGVIKRHNQTRGPMTHGSRFHRRPGSMGTMRPMRVMKGKKLPGHMGNETSTMQNLEIIDINLVENYLLISGNIPGPKNGLVLVKSAVKIAKPNKHPYELLSYEEETVVDAVEEVTTDEVVETPVEETAPVETETTEEVVEETVAEEAPVETPAEETVETTPEEEVSE